MSSNAWYDYINQLHYHIQEQDKRIKDLESRIKTLEQNGQTGQQTTIEKLEYHFDQLKIERLDRTLHIGLSPEDLSNVEDLSLNQSPIKQPTHSVPMEQQLIAQLDTYLTEEGPIILEQLAEEYSYPLDHAYMEKILTDVRKQLPSRMTHYRKMVNNQHPNTNAREQSMYIIDHLKKEIEHSLRLFFQNEQNKGDN